MLLAVSQIGFSMPYSSVLQIINTMIAQSDSMKIQTLLEKNANTLSEGAKQKVLTALECTKTQHIEHKPILLIIDYSIPSNEKRLWVFDLQKKQLLFHTYVSHGIRSGTLLSNYFSNVNNSKASSIGVYKTEGTYYGRDGLSLRLEGLEKNFNHNANLRYLVIHGGWYMDEQFIKKYGRPGRSWGCPALPLQLTQSIINTIKDGALFVAYYPSEDWFVKSRFLNCHTQKAETAAISNGVSQVGIEEPRESILYVDLKHDNKRAENDPILVMNADTYERIFKTKAPLGRMLRRQIQNNEYIALSNTEFEQIMQTNDQEALHSMRFVIPVIKMVRGYYETQMQIVPIGTINGAQADVAISKKGSLNKSYSVTFEAQPALHLTATNQFIRWLGL